MLTGMASESHIASVMAKSVSDQRRRGTRRKRFCASTGKSSAHGVQLQSSWRSTGSSRCSCCGCGAMPAAHSSQRSAGSRSLTNRRRESSGDCSVSSVILGHREPAAVPARGDAICSGTRHSMVGGPGGGRLIPSTSMPASSGAAS